MKVGENNMKTLSKASYWIKPVDDFEGACPEFTREFNLSSPVNDAVLQITAMGIYRVYINGQSIQSDLLTPGWTDYTTRLQYQTYHVEQYLHIGGNIIQVIVGRGWYRSPMPGWMDTPEKAVRSAKPAGLIASLVLQSSNGETVSVSTDKNWTVSKSSFNYSEIYNGESFDARLSSREKYSVASFKGPQVQLIPQEGTMVKKQVTVLPRRLFKDSTGAWIVDFGQEITGYVEISLTSGAGEVVEFTHGEVLDKEGNFYNKNYRSAQAKVRYVCRDGQQTWHPQLTFFGFRYIKLLKYPTVPKLDEFKGIAIFSEMEQTGKISTSDASLNQLISNIFWGQRDNFVDVPTDCPQRDERLGWTGDVAAFIKAASYNYDVRSFFKKWLHDVRSSQAPDGSIGDVVPDYLNDQHVSAAWGDVITIAPWQLYQTYGDESFLRDNFEAMQKWVDYITATTTTQYLWTGGNHFGDWLGLDAESGSYKGSSRDDFIASAYYAHSTELLVLSGNVLGKDVKKYEELLGQIRAKFHQVFSKCLTQTECVLAVSFGLTNNPQLLADQLVNLIHQNDDAMATGFVGTPLLLPVLSKYGYSELAAKLLLRHQYPSWLYAVDLGATTIWEHWDGIKEDGSFWSDDMNSFNHYSYGAVISWMYENLGGIKPLAPGFKKIVIEPEVPADLDSYECCLKTVHGLIRSKWARVEQKIRFDISLPVDGVVNIFGESHQLAKGNYILWGKNEKNS